MKINVKRTCIEITPYNDDNRVESLENSLSVYNKSCYRYDPIGLYYDVDKEKLIIPRSLSLRSLEQTFNVPSTLDRSSDPIDKIPIKLKTSPRDDTQKELISFLLGKDKYENIERYSRVMADVDTGIGKTYCSMAYIAHKQIKGAIIVHNTNLMEQWRDKIIEYTNLNKKEIFIVSGSDSITKILEGASKKYKIFIVSHMTIQSYAKKHGWDSITELFQVMKIGVKIFDEAHLSMINTLRIDMFTNTKKTIYLTATANRSSYREDKLYQSIYAQVPVFEFHRKKEDAYIRSIVMEYQSEPTLSEQGKMSNVHGLDTNYYMEYQVFGRGKKLFFKSLSVVLNTILPKEGKIAILLSRKRAVNAVYKYILENFEEYADDIGIFTSDIVDKKKRNQQLEKRIILTTSKSFGTGMDIANLRMLIMCEPYSSKVILKQITGRLRDIGGELYYFELVDVGIPQRTRQFNTIKKDLQKRSENVTSFTIKE